jgi:hypothetical protein
MVGVPRTAERGHEIADVVEIGAVERLDPAERERQTVRDDRPSFATAPQPCRVDAAAAEVVLRMALEPADARRVRRLEGEERLDERRSKPETHAGDLHVTRAGA